MSQPRRSRHGSSGWLTTFADLAALLLSFFVLSFSMGTMQQGDLQAISSSFVARTDVGDRQDQNFVAAEHTVDQVQIDASRSADYVAALLQARLTEAEATAGYVIATEGEAVVVTLDPTMLEAGSERWTSDGERVADLIVDMAEQERAWVTILATRLAQEDAAAGLSRAWGLALELALLERQTLIQIFSVPSLQDQNPAPVRIEIRPEGDG